MTIVGAGKFTYTYIQDWAKMPGSQSLGTVSAIATDSQDRVYAFQRAEPPVVIFNRNGEFLSSWGNGNFVDPHGLFIKDDIVYLTDREGSTAMRYTLDGKPLQIIGTLGEYSDTGCEVTGAVCPRSAGPFNYITEMVPHPSGDLYISDGYRNARVHRFSKDGTLVSSWGESGKGGPNEFHLPHSLVVGQDGRIYLCDRENSRIQVFSAEGEYITMWTDMQRPLDISQDLEGNFVISERVREDGGPAQMSVLDGEGNVLARWPSRSAHGSWVDAHGDIYLALTAEKSIDKYVRQT
ncbi:MAG: 6-bladed beta-propeller [Chloroflexota bacterium]|nr:6-bladed beta-propeller [Chloroflexota bacterium]